MRTAMQAAPEPQVALEAFRSIAQWWQACLDPTKPSLSGLMHINPRMSISD